MFRFYLSNSGPAKVSRSTEPQPAHLLVFPYIMMVQYSEFILLTLETPTWFVERETKLRPSQN